jgi:excisionase family DNA binding protein
MDQLRTIKDVAAYLSVSLRTVRRLRLPSVRVGRSVRCSSQVLGRRGVLGTVRSWRNLSGSPASGQEVRPFPRLNLR